MPRGRAKARHRRPSSKPLALDEISTYPLSRRRSKVTLRQLARPHRPGARFSAFETGAPGGAPALGEHNREVLQGLLGLSDDELAGLQETKVIGDTPEFAVPLQVVQAMVQWPLTSLLQMGALAALEPDYKQQLGIGPENGG